MRATAAPNATVNARFRSPFPPLEFSIEDEVQLESVAHMFVRNTLVKFEAHEHHARRVVDLARWKLVKRKDGACVYIERCSADTARRRRKREQNSSGGGSSLSTISQLLFHHRHQYPQTHDQYAEPVASSSPHYIQERESTAATGSPASGDSVYSQQQQQRLSPHGAAQQQTKSTTRPDLPVLLAVGTMEGTLEDAMYGIVAPSVDTIRVRSSFVLDNLTDAEVLATLVAPTPREPFRTLSVKWVEKRVQARVLSLDRLAKPRDSVVLESTGTTQLASGETVGYWLLHSVHFPQTQPLPGTTRNNMSVCCILRQHSATSVGFFLKGYMSLPRANTLVRAIAVKVAARSVVSVRKFVEWGRMKKLVFALEQRHRRPVEQIRDKTAGDGVESIDGDFENNSNYTSGDGGGSDDSTNAIDRSAARVNFCANCKKRAPRRHRHIFQRRPTAQSECKLCLEYVCASCSIKKKLGYVAPGGQLQHNEVTLCALCIHVAMIQTDTIAVASKEVALSTAQWLPIPLPMKTLPATSSMGFSDRSLFDHASPW